MRGEREREREGGERRETEKRGRVTVRVHLLKCLSILLSNNKLVFCTDLDVAV